MIDYSQYYNLESHLFDTVARNFHNRHYLTAEEFFCIVIWKANRAKSKIAKKFEKQGSLDKAIKEFSSLIYNAPTNKDKMAILIKDYKFLLPMASAILSVLYQDEFSVYDIRVCDMLEKAYPTGNYHKISNWTFERLWLGYEDYLLKILDISGLDNFREADKYLWGKSFYEQLQDDLRREFR